MTKQRSSRVSASLVAFTLFIALCAAVAVTAALYPSADAITVLQDQDTVMDASHADQGYIMVRHSPTKKALKLRVIKGDSTYTYNLASDDAFETFPLTAGSGTYQVQVFKQVSGKRYANDASFRFQADIVDETLPFLYPNQYVWYTEASEAVARSMALCEGLNGVPDKVEAIRSFVADTVVYDFHRASTVQSGYIPDIDDVLAKREGICFDYAALTACMLRVQGIPTQLVIGYADTIYHAWNLVLVDGAWQRVDTTADANSMKVKKYTEERVY